jgi:hypothetical protein
MIMRFVVPATAAALMLSVSAFAAQTSTSAQSSGMQQCTQLESQIATDLQDAIPSASRKATAERDEGMKLCNSGKTDEGIAKLQQALTDVMYRG